MNKTDKIQTIILFVLALGLVGVLLVGSRRQVVIIHDLPAEPQTMRVYEDGSFSGCMKGGLCND